MKTLLLALLACALPAQIAAPRWNYLPMRGQEFTGLVFTFENEPGGTVMVDLEAIVDGDKVHKAGTFKSYRSPRDPRAGCISMDLGKRPDEFRVLKIYIYHAVYRTTCDKQNHCETKSEIEGDQVDDPLPGKYYGLRMQ